jgi:hypothetical protein
MCTVTYIPVKGGAYISSNRDERRGRPPAAKPAIVAGRTGQLLFPRDTQAGGSWFVVHEKGTVLVLLNGARERHIPHPPYRKSRGLILLELADSEDVLKEFKSLNLNEIEPFTLILLEDGCLYECLWDGIEKVHRPIDVTLPQIWSSVTLYDASIRQKRREWWDTWLQGNPAPGQEQVLGFHQFTGGGDPRTDVLMNREEGLLTVSITSVKITDEEARMQYLDILDGRSVSRQLLLIKEVTPAKDRLPALSIPASL